MVKISIPLLLLAALLDNNSRGVNAAGNDEEELIETIGVTPQETTNKTSYKCTFRNLWTKERHPQNFPKELGRWGGPIMYTHTLQFQPWANGKSVTPGIEKIAEDGFTDTFIQEMDQQGTQVKDYSNNPGNGFFVSDEDFVHMPPIEANFAFPYLSVIAGMSPSPDWYTGFYSFWLIDENARNWYDHIKIQTFAWDAGSDAGTTYDSSNSDLDPGIAISRFRGATKLEGGELQGPDGDFPPVGEWECFLVVGDEPLIMPECDYFANPCCNETDTENCGNLLPNGATPQLSPAYAQVLAESGGGDKSGAMQHFPVVALVVGLSAMQWILA